LYYIFLPKAALYLVCRPSLSTYMFQNRVPYWLGLPVIADRAIWLKR